MKTMKRWAATVAFACLPAGALALPCTGASAFADVATADIFCTDAQWLANRGVTTGCAAGLYCPADYVSRAQMALFMQRLGTALSPVSRRTFAVNQVMTPLATSANPPSPDAIWCPSEVLEATPYPRLVVASGFVSMVAGAGGARMQAYTATSTDGGVTWSRVGNLVFNQQDMAQSVAHSFPIAAHIPLAAGTGLQVGVFLRKHAGTAVIVSVGECEVNLLVFSQTGSTAPFDASTADRRP
jgi:hypothetical protein